MSRVLIPFAEPEGALRAVRQLIAEPREPGLSVHLLAAVESRVSGRVRLHVSSEHAEALTRAAAARWLAPLEAMLAAAAIPFTTEIAIGAPLRAIQQAAACTDVDRVLLPASRAPWRRRRDQRWIARHTTHPVSIVA